MVVCLSCVLFEIHTHTRRRFTFAAFLSTRVVFVWSRTNAGEDAQPPAGPLSLRLPRRSDAVASMKSAFLRAAKASTEPPNLDQDILSKLATRQSLVQITAAAKAAKEVNALLEDPKLPSEQDADRWWPDPPRPPQLSPLVPFSSRGNVAAYRLPSAVQGPRTPSSRPGTTHLSSRPGITPSPSSRPGTSSSPPPAFVSAKKG